MNTLKTFMNEQDLLCSRTRDVKLPSKAYSTDAGFDFFIPNEFESILIPPNSDKLIPSGIKVIVPHGYALIAFNKSGVCTKLKLRTGACVVDENYTGEVHIHLFNDSFESVELHAGQKIIQFVLVKIGNHQIREVSSEEYKELSKQEHESRSIGGFGSTDNK